MIDMSARSEAKEKGLTRYFTGKPCKHGHVCQRWVYNSACLECSSSNAKRWAKENHVRIAANARRWRRENPEKATANQKRSNAKWFAKEENKVAARKYGRARYVVKRDLILKQSRERRIRDIDKVRERQKAWYQKNKDVAFALVRNRKAMKRAASGKHTAKDIAEIFKLQHGCCAYCRMRLGSRKHVDHIIPLVLGGANDRRNLQILCPPCNLSKGPKHPIDFGRERGMLL